MLDYKFSFNNGSKGLHCDNWGNQSSAWILDKIITSVTLSQSDKDTI